VQIVSVDTLAWEPLGRNGIRRKLLYRDGGGAETMLIEIPRGWKGGGIAHHHSFFEEVFVIDGDVTLNGRDDLVRNSYVYRPAAVVHGHAESAREGAFAMVRNGGPLDMNFVPEPLQDVEYPLRPIEDGRGLIVHLASDTVRSTPLAPGIVEKRLSGDTKTGASTALVALEAEAAWRAESDRPLALLLIEGALTIDKGPRLVPGTHAALGPREAAVLRAEVSSRLLVWRA
jgi:hypothetical protein